MSCFTKRKESKEHRSIVFDAALKSVENRKAAILEQYPDAHIRIDVTDKGITFKAFDKTGTKLIGEEVYVY